MKKLKELADLNVSIDVLDKSILKVIKGGVAAKQEDASAGVDPSYGNTGSDTVPCCCACRCESAQ